MTFPSLNAQPNKTYGTTLSSDKIKDSRNVWVKDGALKSRKGVEFNRDKVFDTEYPTSSLEDFVFVDENICYGADRLRIAYSLFREDTADELLTGFIDSDGNISFAERMFFLRFDYSTFYRPQSFNFFNACDTNGKEQLYLMVMTACYRVSGMEYEPRLFVYNPSDNRWDVSLGGDPYQPIVLMNGQGDSYAKAVEDFEIDKFTPYYPESINLFSGWCRSYFTSDGYSYRFKTPCEKFASEQPVTVTFEDINGKKTWTIPYNADELAITFSGESLKILCFREYGAISFVKANGTPYPLPRHYECSNNLLITACDRNSVSKYNNISSCLSLVTVDYKMMMCNDYEKSNVLYYVDLKKGLYAPQNACINIGKDGTKLVAVKHIGNRIFAFKENEIYSVKPEYGKQAKYTMFPMKLNQQLYYSDTLSTDFISGTVGCHNPETLTVNGDTAYWLNNDGCVYYLDKNGKFGVFCNIKEQLSEITENFGYKIKGCAADGYYVLCGQNKIILVNLSDKHIFVWEMPDGMTVFDVVDIYGKLMLSTGESDRHYVCVCELSDDRDTLAHWLDGTEITYEKSYYDVYSKIKTEKLNLDLPFTRKIFESVLMKISAKKGFHITFDTKNRRFVNLKSEKYKTVKLLPHLRANENIQFTVESSGEISFGDISINYRTVSDRF